MAGCEKNIFLTLTVAHQNFQNFLSPKFYVKHA
jgi:hypothetical protein